MRAPFPVFLFKISSGIIVAACLAACTTTEDKPASQTATAPPQSSTPESMAAKAADDTPGRSAIPPGALIDPVYDIPDRVYFAYDKADLSPESVDALQKQADWLQKYPAATLVIEGHSDERGTREYNLALGARRATAVRTFLITRGVNAARLETVSYGKERPICTTSREECWHQNRRAMSTIKPLP
jgi:peptidoglycan-associated lipoprotein